MVLNEIVVMKWRNWIETLYYYNLWSYSWVIESRGFLLFQNILKVSISNLFSFSKPNEKEKERKHLNYSQKKIHFKIHFLFNYWKRSQPHVTLAIFLAHPSFHFQSFFCFSSFHRISWSFRDFINLICYNINIYNHKL